MIATNQYEHTQIGWWLLTGVGALLAVFVAILIFQSYSLPGLVATVVLGLVLTLFYKLTVRINPDAIEIKFGLGFVRRYIVLEEVESCRIVRNRWYYGWGTRVTPHGSLYSVSGLDAVEVQLKSGAKVRIGTDEPRVLEEAINRAVSDLRRNRSSGKNF